MSSRIACPSLATSQDTSLPFLRSKLVPACRSEASGQSSRAYRQTSQDLDLPLHGILKFTGHSLIDCGRRISWSTSWGRKGLVRG